MAIAKKKILAWMLGAGLLAAAGGQAMAETTTGNLGVSITVPPTCTLFTRPLLFASRTFITAAVDNATTLSMQCSIGTFYYLTIGLGANSTGTPPVRRMASGTGEFINYELYTNVTRTTHWLSAVATAPTAAQPVAGAPSATGTGLNQNFIVYGRVPLQNAVPGNYTDSVVVTVTY